MNTNESRIVLLALAKNLSHFYIMKNDRLFLSKSKITEYTVFMTEALYSSLNLDKTAENNTTYSSFDDEMNPNYQSDCELLTELFSKDCILENVNSLDKKSIDNLVSNLSTSLYQSYNEKVSSYMKHLLHDCLSDDFDIEDEDEIQEVCYRVANRLRDYQYEEY